MNRLRLALLALVLAVAVPAGLLVSRALSSIEFERQVRHEAVAERVFDEMERALTRFLEQEEARPAEEYRFYSQVHEGLPLDAGGLVRSPLSRPASEPFVVAHFQIDPGGRLSTPLRPLDERLASNAGDWPASGDEAERVERAVSELEQRVAPFWREAKARRLLARSLLEEKLERTGDEQDELGDREPTDDRAARIARVTPRADSKDDAKSRSTGPGEPDARDALAAAPPQPETGQKKEKAGKASAYEIFQSLNRGAQERQMRKQVVTEAPRYDVTDGRLARAKTPDSLGDLGGTTDAPKRQRAEVRSPAAASAPRAIEPEQRSEADGSARAASPYGAEGPFDADDSLEYQPDYMAARAAPSEQRYGAGESLLDLEEGVFEAEAEAPAAQRTLTAERVRVILEPMAGQRLDEDHLMLYRTVLVGERGYRQGLLLDEQALGRWLQREVIGGGKLAGGVALRFGPDAGGVPAPGGYFVSNHAFAEPFDGLRARLAVAPLRGMGSTFTIYALAGLLALVALAGLAAVYRMVSVVVQFAERRSNFVSAVSHELKTPLTAIRMYGEMLRDGLVSSEEKRDEYYRTISDESERLSRLIDNVLEFSRLEKGSREFNLSVGSLGDVVADVCARLQPHVEREGFALRVEVEGELPPVRFDRDALVQMLFNLVDNAMKYASGAGQREIVVRCARAQGGRVALSVRDFGPGVPRQHLTRIFEPFFRGEAELTRSARGSGIGLALVKQLAESMDAIVSGGNAEGGGFRVSIAFEAG